MSTLHAPAHNASDARLLIQQAAGYAVYRGAVEADLIDAALRRLNLEITRTGLTPDEIRASIHGTFFPHVRWDREILALQDRAARLLQPVDGEQWADPQLLLRFPDEASSWPPTAHIDDVPPWAPDRRYVAIVGVAISRSWHRNGCLLVWPGSHLGRPSNPKPVELDAGDAVVMHPALSHCSGLNRGGAVRYATYFRLLGTAPALPGGTSP